MVGIVMTTTYYLIGIALTTIVLTINLDPAFADYQTDPWEVAGDDPTGCSGGVDDYSCADGNTSGNSYIYSVVDDAWESRDAWVWHNGDGSSVDDDPKLTISASNTKVYFKITSDYDGVITADASGSESVLFIGVQAWDDGVIAYHFAERIDGAGVKDDIETFSFWLTNQGTNTYRIVGEYNAVTWTTAWSGDTEVDFWNGGNYIKTTKLEVTT